MRRRSSTWLAAVISGGLAFGGAALAQPAKKAPPAKIDVKAAVAALSSADVTAAARAATELGTSGDAAAHDGLLDALAMGLPPEVAVAAVAALTAHPAPPDVGALVRYAGHHAPAVRGAALGALALYPDPVAHGAVVAGLHDPVAVVRATAAAAAAKGRVREALDSLFALLALGEDPAGLALAQLADPALTARIADQLGKVPEAALARCLGAILRRADYGPDPARVEIVRALAKIQDQASTKVLTDYVDATPKNPPRASRDEAEKIVEARVGGGGK